MTTSSNPDEIRAEIERTRAELSDNVDALTDTANPKNVAKRQAGKVKDAVMGAKDHVMGSAHEQAERGSDAVGGAKDAVASRASAVGDAVSSAPAKAKGKTRGNPLAAGLIAFGAGLLISGLIPSTEQERAKVADLKANLEPVKEKATEALREVGDNLKAPAQEALASVKDTAAEATETVKAEGSQAQEQVRGQVQDSKNSVQQH